MSHCPCQIKCDQYWPNRGTEIYGFMHITLLDVMELATYTIRTFHVIRVSVCDRTDTESATYGLPRVLTYTLEITLYSAFYVMCRVCEGISTLFRCQFGKQRVWIDK